MVDGSHGENNVKIIPWAVKLLDGGGKNPGLRKIELPRHRLECPVAFAGVIAAFSQRLQTHNVAGAMHRRPQAEHSFAAANLQHGPIAEINVAEKLPREPREVKAVVPQAHFLADLPNAFCWGNGLTGRNCLVHG